MNVVGTKDEWSVGCSRRDCEAQGFTYSLSLSLSFAFFPSFDFVLKRERGWRSLKRCGFECHVSSQQLRQARLPVVGFLLQMEVFVRQRPLRLRGLFLLLLLFTALRQSLRLFTQKPDCALVEDTRRRTLEDSLSLPPSLPRRTTA